MNYCILRNYYKKLNGVILLLRPVNILITFISVFIGAWVGGNIYPLKNLFYACLSGALICGGGNVLNDYFDAESDMINKPNRPIPSQIKCSYSLDYYFCNWIYSKFFYQFKWDVYCSDCCCFIVFL